MVNRRWDCVGIRYLDVRRYQTCHWHTLGLVCSDTMNRPEHHDPPQDVIPPSTMETDTTLSLAGPSESIILDDKPVSPSIDVSTVERRSLPARVLTRSFQWYKFWPIPGFSAAYGVHQYFRRHRPRRLPVLTPMRPLELYIALCFTYILVYDNVEREMEVIDDKDLLTIELAGRLARRAMLSNPNFRSKFEHFHRKVLDPDDELNETFRKMREGWCYVLLSGRSWC